jgi:rod shape-determining protein MreD
MLTLVRRPVVRLLMVGLVLLTVQTTLLTELRPFGFIVDVMLGFSVASGVVGGPEHGAFAGFVYGLLFDLVLTTPFGLSALSYALAAYVAGAVKTSITVGQAWWLTMALVAGGSALGVVLYAVGGAIVGEQGWLQSRLFAQIIVIATFNGLLGPLMTPVQRWALCLERDA